MSYFFILGRNSALSIAEIFAMLGREAIAYIPQRYSPEVLVIETETPVEHLFSELGGSSKFGKIVGMLRETKDVVNLLPQTEKKLHFGFSFYPLATDTPEKIIQEKQTWLTRQAMEIKKQLRASGRSTRFVVGRERALSSVIVKTNKLLTSGAELCFFVSKNETLIGKTLDVQPFEEYEFRDYGRPRRDMMRGMLPPKIAKIMINLAALPKNATLLDPFCGVGTVLSEAIIVGYKNLIGADVDEKAINDARENLEWTKKQYADGDNSGDSNQQKNISLSLSKGDQPSKNTSDYRLFTADVRELATKFPRESVDAIVTEPFLGPLLRGGETPDTIQKIKSELERLYAAAFQNFEKILKPRGTVVFIFPVWRTSKGNVFIDLENVVPKNFHIVPPLPRDIKFAYCNDHDTHNTSDNQRVSSRAALFAKHLPTDLCPTARGSIVWQRPDQKVLREIVVLKYTR